MTHRFFFLLICAVFVIVPGLAQSEESDIITTRDALPDPFSFEIAEVTGGLNRPLSIAHAGDGSGRLFVVEQAGAIRIVKEGQLLSTPFIDLSDRVSQDVRNGYSERGLLGLAFHPEYAETGYFYVNYNDARGTTHISRFSVSEDNPDVANPDSEFVMLTVAQPFANHNGGELAFGPDGYLYIGLGDGGSAGDPEENGQDPADLLGKVLRIDVDAAGPDQPYGIPEDNPFSSNPELAPEVWAWGLRNPWRFSFDRATGDLYIADVGQSRYEEVNFQPAESTGGENYGWDVFEGTELYEGWMGEPVVETVEPVATYTHDEGCSITGGYVYRGEAMPWLQAYYFYSDYCSGNLWAAYRTESGEWRSGRLLSLNINVSSLGEDEEGELYLLNYRSGTLLKFMPSS